MPQLRVKSGPQKTKVIQVEGSSPIVIGRDATAGLQIIDKGVSREHAEVYRVGEMVFIRDLGSRNGSFVNEEQVEEELLREGDVIRVGSTQLVFESTKAAQERGSELQFEDGEGFKTSLELKVDDLFVGEGQGTGRETEYFRAICKATNIVYGERDEKKLFERLLDLVAEYIPADHLYLFLRDEATGAIVPRATKIKQSGSNVPISRTILRRVISESRAILTADAMMDERFKMGDSIVMNQIRSVLCVPVLSGAATHGAIYAVNARIAETFDQTDLELLTAVGSQLAASLENLTLIRGRRRMLIQLIGHLVRLLEKEMPGHAGHAERVSQFCAAIGRELGVSDNEVLYLRIAGMLHDLGKHKALAGDAAATDQVAGHVQRASEYFKNVPSQEHFLAYVRSHHERLDGKGVPDGLKGDAIPLGARILAVANAFEHLLFDGIKEPGVQPDSNTIRKALTEVGNMGGEAYDLNVIKALMVAHRHGTLFGGSTIVHEAPEKAEAPAEPVDPTAMTWQPDKKDAKEKDDMPLTETPAKGVKKNETDDVKTSGRGGASKRGPSKSGASKRAVIGEGRSSSES
ncbi:MAG: FHA domain-containing protein [Planctomycetes bacterium]|nr:FHA domain-containing protein [Planctomycetota bacterium]